MHPLSHREDARRLARRGRSASQIASELELPRSTVRAWLAAAEPTTPICLACGRPEHEVAPVAAEYAYLLGLYLGDGCISSHARGVYRLRVILDARYPGIIHECASAIAAIAPRNRVNQRACAASSYGGSRPGTTIEVSAYSKSWPCLFPQHGPGRKHERLISLADWQTEIAASHPDRLLRGLIHSDGCRFMNTGRNWRAPRYSFSNRSADIKRIFCDACDQVGIHWTTAPHTVYVSRIADVARLDEFIGPKA